LNTLLLIGALVVAGAFLAGAPQRRRRWRARRRWVAGVALLAGVAALGLQGRGTTLAKTLSGKGVTARGHTAMGTAHRKAAVPARLSGSVLNDAGFAKIRAGDYKGALPLLEQAVKRLRGTGSIVNAYALYNLAVARFEVGRCDGVLAMLDRSQARQGHRYEIDRLRAQARRRCKGR
jgi:hypothetical protein